LEGLVPTPSDTRHLRLVGLLTKPEGPRDHVANAIQLLLDVDALLEQLSLIPEPVELREALHAAEARLFKALFQLADPVYTEDGDAPADPRSIH
jgi:hypothetical protein